jgi:hypothetical protein
MLNDMYKDYGKEDKVVWEKDFLWITTKTCGAKFKIKMRPLNPKHRFWQI